uniref:Uncharacterized protein n=1 Tax=Anguilla anguilla TaxID=7936 RepID=A0A0E9RDN6_ANGAN
MLIYCICWRGLHQTIKLLHQTNYNYSF